ncbi:hypothetical protein [Nostoc sp. LPT]|uniref:hypothetical protein n=1 Tax=Nostoc sp. LPT TaxID=2815387 RepID=UPI0025E348BF|nr:hypothetical protein [Nostoc sp. LPT]
MFFFLALSLVGHGLQTWWNLANVGIAHPRHRSSIQAVANPVDFYLQRFAKVLGEPLPVGADPK